MSFLLRPMIWYKFIGGMVALKGKYCFSSFPQPCLQMHITAFPNGVGHLSALWRTKRVARMWGCYIQLQQEAALRQTDMFRGKCLNFDAFVGCQTILPALVHDRADASAEGTSAKGDMGDRDHDRTCRSGEKRFRCPSLHSRDHLRSYAHIHPFGRCLGVCGPC